MNAKRRRVPVSVLFDSKLAYIVGQAERTALLQRYEELQAQHVELEKQLDSFTTPDEVKLAETKRACPARLVRRQPRGDPLHGAEELIERLKTSAIRSTGTGPLSVVPSFPPRAHDSLCSADNISAFLSYQRNTVGSEAADASRQEHDLPEDFDDLSFP